MHTCVCVCVCIKYPWYKVSGNSGKWSTSGMTFHFRHHSTCHWEARRKMGECATGDAYFVGKDSVVLDGSNDERIWRITRYDSNEFISQRVRDRRRLMVWGMRSMGIMYMTQHQEWGHWGLWQTGKERRDEVMMTSIEVLMTWHKTPIHPRPLGRDKSLLRTSNKYVDPGFRWHRRWMGK